MKRLLAMNGQSKRNTCPNCGDAAVEAYAPFCTRRCAEVDLGHWFNENYVIAGRDAEDMDGNLGEDEDQD